MNAGLNEHVNKEGLNEYVSKEGLNEYLNRDIHKNSSLGKNITENAKKRANRIKYGNLRIGLSYLRISQSLP